jgi:hypothetical protein
MLTGMVLNHFGQTNLFLRANPRGPQPHTESLAARKGYSTGCVLTGKNFPFSGKNFPFSKRLVNGAKCCRVPVLATADVLVVSKNGTILSVDSYLADMR